MKKERVKASAPAETRIGSVSQGRGVDMSKLYIDMLCEKFKNTLLGKKRLTSKKESSLLPCTFSGLNFPNSHPKKIKIYKIIPP